jgi:nitrite reductase (NADH) large subunit
VVVKQHVIIGNSGAAISAVRAIRQITVDDKITVISQENCAAYSPVLDPYYLSGRISPADMFICDAGFYAQNRVDLRLGKKAVKVDPAAQKVFLEDGDWVHYDELLIATGSSSQVPPIEGVSLPGVFTLWSMDDTRRIIEAVRSAGTVAIWGTGLIGMQSLAALLARGKKVILIGRREQVMFRILDEEAGRIVENKLRKAGVELHFKDQVTRISARSDKKVLSLASGAEIVTDIVVLALGVTPNVSLLKDSGVIVNRGVVVDEYCRTSVENIYAAGDVAEGIDGLTGERQLNATWTNAVEQGAIAGLNMAGKKTSGGRKLRFNALSLCGLSCASIGLTRAEGADARENVQRYNGDYRKLIFKDGVLVGAVLVGDIGDAGILTRLIEKRTRFSNPDAVRAFADEAAPFFKSFAVQYGWSRCK